LVAALGVAAGGAVALVASCLPDLVADTPDAGVEGGALCGNGIIDEDAGEVCDPGKGEAGVGCGPTCQIVCDPDGGGYVDLQTNHCYFLLSSTRVPNSVGESVINGCPSVHNAAHVVTFVSRTEVSTVNAGLAASDRYWVGLRVAGVADSGSKQWGSEFVAEPGWAANGTCTGCYSTAGTDAVGFKSVDEAGTAAPCVLAPKGAPGIWYAASCLDLALSVCEREPPGSRAQPCNAGDWCFDVKATQGMKRYEYHPTLVGPLAARDTCRQTDGGTKPSLVVFETSAEREQVLHELLNLPGTAPPTVFWIGLSRTDGDAASPWTWEDSQPLGSYDLPWGIGAPEPGGTRAFVRQDSVSVDTQLSHSSSLTSASFVCQY
jgi:hypothetical protein